MLRKVLCPHLSAAQSIVSPSFAEASADKDKKDCKDGKDDGNPQSFVSPPLLARIPGFAPCFIFRSGSAACMENGK